LVQTLPTLNFNLEELEELTSKVELSQILSVSRQTLNVYHQLAKLHIEGFYENYPKVGDKAYTRAGMNKYQAWVVGKLVYEGTRLTYKVLKANLEDSEFAELFSYSQFIKRNQGAKP
jgi:hypothetical protein